ncbi:hypothetical protein LINPERHAP1_LOCUS23173 [Linum perenne]
MDPIGFVFSFGLQRIIDFLQTLRGTEYISVTMIIAATIKLHQMTRYMFSGIATSLVNYG